MLHAHVSNLVITVVGHQSIFSTRRHSHIVRLVKAAALHSTICTSCTSIASKCSHQRIRQINDSDLVRSISYQCIGAVWRDGYSIWTVEGSRCTVPIDATGATQLARKSRHDASIDHEMTDQFGALPRDQRKVVIRRQGYAVRINK
jgi:hypothetical protein